MSDKFVASNGVEVHINEYTQLCISSGRPAEHTQAAREFFQHERDEELGRWRDPQARSRVVTEIDHRRVYVYDEETRQYSEFDDAGQGKVNLLTQGNFGLNGTALRYFAAHPEPKPAWHDAKSDEVWKFTSKDRERKALAWRSWDDWGVMTPRGRQIRAVDDPITALIENGYEEFAELESAVKMTEAP